MKPPFLGLVRIKLKGVSALLRRRYFRMLGLDIEMGGQLGKITCLWPNKVRIGKDCIIQDGVDLWTKSPYDEQNCICIGDRVFIGRSCVLSCNSKIIIGNDCMIANNTIIIDVNHQTDKRFLINKQLCDQQEIVIGNDVWIGAGCIILKGVVIGNGSVIGAGAVVNKAVPEYEIWAGVPARKIGTRN